MNTELTANQYSAIALLMSGKNRVEVSEILKINVSALNQWIATPKFKQKQREAAISVYEESLANVANLTSKAVSGLEKILDDDEESTRTKITAITLILNHAEKLKSYELERRLERVENILSPSYLEITASVES